MGKISAFILISFVVFAVVATPAAAETLSPWQVWERHISSLEETGKSPYTRTDPGTGEEPVVVDLGTEKIRLWKNPSYSEAAAAEATALQKFKKQSAAPAQPAQLTHTDAEKLKDELVALVKFYVPEASKVVVEHQSTESPLDIALKIQQMELGRLQATELGNFQWDRIHNGWTDIFGPRKTWREIDDDWSRTTQSYNSMGNNAALQTSRTLQLERELERRRSRW